MTETHTRPLNEVLQSFDGRADGFNEHEVASAIRLAEETTDDDFARQTELIAFELHEEYKDEATGWGTYYGPMFAGPARDGTGAADYPVFRP